MIFLRPHPARFSINSRLVAFAALGALAALIVLAVASVAPAQASAGQGGTRADGDGDRLSDRYERRRSHTSVRRRDTDRDGLGDGYEVRRSRTNPRRRDTDRDGLKDGYELKRSKTNPRRRDTDRDGLGDGYEVRHGSNPRDASSPGARSSKRHDRTPPETSITSAASSPTSTTASFYFTSNEAGSVFDCRLDGGIWQRCTSPKSYSGLSAGTHTFQVRAIDRAGNVDATPASRTWTIESSTPDPEPTPPPADTAPPDTTITAGPSGTVATGDASFSFSASESGSTFECRLDGAAYSPCSSPKAYSGLANGSHSFDVRATDAAGNVDSAPASRTWTVSLPSTNCSKTLAAPSTTAQLQSFLDSLVAGDVACLRGGNHGTATATGGLNFTKIGTATSPIELRSYPGERATIKPIVRIPGDYLRLRYLTFDGDHVHTVSSMWLQSGSASVELLDSEFRESGVANPPSTNKDGNCVYVDAGTANLRVLRNRFIDCGTNQHFHHGLYLNGTGHVIANNLIKGARWAGIQAYPNFDGGTIADNTLVDSGGPGLIIGSGSCSNRVVNNIAASNGYRDSSTYPGYDAYSVSCTSTTLNRVETNLCWQNAAGCYTASSGITYTDMLTADPLFVSTSDFHLRAGSAAINRGRVDGLLSPDLDGESRPQGSAPDLGAYEDG